MIRKDYTYQLNLLIEVYKCVCVRVCVIFLFGMTKFKSIKKHNKYKLICSCPFTNQVKSKIILILNFTTLILQS